MYCSVLDARKTDTRSATAGPVVMPALGLHEQLADEARLSEHLARRSRQRREKAANSRRLPRSARTGAKRRFSKTTPPMDWLRSLTCRLVYGEPTPDGIRPSNTKKQLRSRWNLGWHIAKLANYQFADHFAGRATYYFFGNGDPDADHTPVMIDIDVGKSLGLGSPAGPSPSPPT